jgi:hypothetical protein
MHDEKLDLVVKVVFEARVLASLEHAFDDDLRLMMTCD